MENKETVSGGGMDELRLLMTVFVGKMLKGASAEEAVRHLAQYGESIAPEMAAQINPDAGPKASFFRLLARAMWNNLPQPGNNYRLSKLPEPGRNDPCFCGSLRKYKHCCAHLPEFPIEPALMLEALLEAMPKKYWADLAGSAVDRHTVAHLAFLWQEAGRHQEVADLLEPWFKGEGAIRNNEAQLLEMLLDSYLELDKPRKRKALALTAIQRGEGEVRSIGWQRVALLEADKGNWDAAHKALVEAQRADPDNLNLGLLEVQLLVSQGNPELAQERAKYWALRLSRFNDPDLQDQIAWLREVAQNPHAAMMQVVREGDETVSELEALLRDAPPVACLYRLEPVEGSAGPFMPEARVAKVLVKWSKVFPSSPPSLTSLFSYNEIAWDEAADWLTLLRKEPLLWSSFEVLDDVVSAVDGCGMSWVVDTLTPLLLDRAERLFDAVLSKYDAGALQCEWGWMENRPALRLLARKAMDGMDSPETARREAAFVLMRRFVEVLNPHDNHGFRTFVAAGLLERGLAAEACKLAERYPDDMANMQYTYALALHQSGREREAQKQLHAAVKEYPKLAKFLLAEAPRQPRQQNQFAYTLGSDEEAWLYREEFRSTWEKLGALAWLREQTRR